MRRAGIAVGSVVSVVLTHAAPAFAQSTGEEPAGGAAIGEAIGATAGALFATALVTWLIAGHRSGRIKLLGQHRELGGAPHRRFPPGRRFPRCCSESRS